MALSLVRVQQMMGLVWMSARYLRRRHRRRPCSRRPRRSLRRRQLSKSPYGFGMVSLAVVAAAQPELLPAQLCL